MMRIRSIRDEAASASIAEYTIVLPLCLIVLGSLILFGFYLSRQAVLDSAVDRAVLIVRSAYADPNYMDIAELGIEDAGADPLGIKSRNALFGLCESDPYRFLAGGYDGERVNEAARRKVLQIVEANHFLRGGLKLSDADVEVREEYGALEKKIRITVRQSVAMPGLFGRMLGNSPFIMEASSVGALSCPTELIRNTDFVLDLTERYTGTDVQKKISGILHRASVLLTGK